MYACFEVKHWSGPMGDEGLHIQIWYCTKFYQTMVLAHEQARLWSGLEPDQILGTAYKTKFGPERGTIKIWSRPNWLC